MELEEEKALAPTLTPAESRLSARELAAYRQWRQLGQPKLSPDTQARFFALYLQGNSVEDIVRLNKGFSLGQISEARVDGVWDLRRDEYLESLFASARDIYQQTTLESIRFIADQLGAVHKKYGDAARRFIQTGDGKDWDFGIDDIKNYKVAVETLQKLTGTDQKVVHQHSHRVEEPVARADRPMDSAEAAKVIKMAVKKK